MKKLNDYIDGYNLLNKLEATIKAEGYSTLTGGSSCNTLNGSAITTGTFLFKQVYGSKKSFDRMHHNWELVAAYGNYNGKLVLFNKTEISKIKSSIK